MSHYIIQILCIIKMQQRVTYFCTLSSLLINYPSLGHIFQLSKRRTFYNFNIIKYIINAINFPNIIFIIIIVIEIMVII